MLLLLLLLAGVARVCVEQSIALSTSDVMQAEDLTVFVDRAGHITYSRAHVPGGCAQVRLSAALFMKICEQRQAVYYDNVESNGWGELTVRWRACPSHLTSLHRCEVTLLAVPRTSR